MKEPHLLPRETLSHAEILRLLSAVPLDTPIHVRDRTVLEVLYSSGIRRQEAADLELSDVDPEGGLLRVRRGKGGKGRMVPLGKEASEAVARYVAHVRPSLLGRREDAGVLFLSKSGFALPGNGDRPPVGPRSGDPEDRDAAYASAQLRDRDDPEPRQSRACEGLPGT